jgi:3-hydroxyacyl-CoA dehydrogenase
MHFFNPVHLMKLLEIVRHATRDESAVATAVARGERRGKTAIVVTEHPPV